MKTFAGQQIEPLFQFSWLVVFLSLLLCGSIAVVLGFTVDPKLAMAVSLSLLALLYLFFGELPSRFRPRRNDSASFLFLCCVIKAVLPPQWWCTSAGVGRVRVGPGRGCSAPVWPVTSGIWSCC